MLSKVGILCVLRMSHHPGTFSSGQKCSILMPRAMSWLYSLCALIAFVLFCIYFVLCPCIMVSCGRNQYVPCHNISPHVLIVFSVMVNGENILVML